VATNYLNNVGKGKTIKAPIVFQGGVSKNVGVIRAFEEATGEKIYVDKNGHLMGALGAAILAKKSGKERAFNFGVKEMKFTTAGRECNHCSNNCEIVCVIRENEFLDGWGNRCEIGLHYLRKEIKNAI